MHVFVCTNVDMARQICHHPPTICIGPGSPRADLGIDQGVADILGHMEGWHLYVPRHRGDGIAGTNHAQEPEQGGQRSQGESLLTSHSVHTKVCDSIEEVYCNVAVNLSDNITANREVFICDIEAKILSMFYMGPSKG